MIKFRAILLLFFIFVFFVTNSINCYNSGNGKLVDGRHHKKKHHHNETELEKKINEKKLKEMKILIGLRKDAEILKNNLDKDTFKILLKKSQKQSKDKEELKKNNKLQFLYLWRQKMRNRIKSLMRKINRLEKKIKKTNLKSINKKKGQRKSKTEGKNLINYGTQDNIKEIAFSDELNYKFKKNKRKDKKMHKKNTLDINKNEHDILLEKARKEERLKSFHLSKNISLSGLAGSSCQSHHECKPGLCCHRVKHPKLSDPKAVCVLHDLTDGSPCKHSCACQSGLQCFSPSKNPKILNGHATCKKASTTDFINGIYENSKETVFDMDHMKLSS